MTAQRLGRLIAAGDAGAVEAAIGSSPRLLTATVERDGQGGWTPLHVAVAECQAGIVRLLVAAGADLGARTEHARTPLHVALEHCPDLVPLLLELGAVLDAPSAAYLGRVDELTAHLDDGVTLDGGTSGVDLLSWAALGGAPATARLLLERGAHADGGALQAAAGGGHLELVRLLLDAGADVDRRDPDTGRVPLHAAVTAGAGDSLEVVDAPARRRGRRGRHHRRRGERPGHQPGGGGPSPAGRRGPGDGERRPGRSPRVPRCHGLGPSHPVGGPDPA